MTTDYIDSKTSSQDFDSKLKEADVVVLCLPLNNNTHNIINAERVALLKKTAILINVARGKVIDNDALYEKQ